MERIEELLLDNGLEGTSYFTGYDYDTAILGYTDEGRLVYSYEKMIEWLTENEEMTQEDAQEWIDYNVLRTIPYMGEKSPVVVYALY
jgi:hypothetical protein